ncbi:MAG TPA: VWA domain-containing protein, partial [Planctomycetota bacterium]|nr:VWA domain-containing protein [Planctomycetota bacterium]
PPPPPPPPPPTTPITPPPTFYGQALTTESSTLMYVIDVSGSMMYLDGFVTRLDRAKAELNKSIAALPNNFKFNIVAFDCSVYSWQPTLVPATADNKTYAESWVTGLIAEGGTATGPGVALGLAVKDNKLVVLLTDGEPNCGAGDEVDGDPTCIAAHRAMIQTANSQRAVINVFGIAAVGEFRQFCLDVAADSGGTYTDVQ